MSETPQPEQPPLLPAVVPHREDNLPIVEGAGSRLYCSLPKTTQREKAKLASLMAGEHPALVDQVNRKLLVEHMIITTVEKTDERTGEVLTLPYVILVTSEGQAYCTFGKVPCNSLSRITGALGLPPWNPPLPLKVIPWTGGPDRKSVQLVLDFDDYCRLLDSPAPAAKPKK